MKPKYIKNIKHISFITVLISAAFWLSACGSQPPRVLAPSAGANPIPDKSQNQVLHKLNTVYASWEGVPYKYGGNDKRGIDCSGFIHAALKTALGLDVPRSTQLLAQSGKQISDKELRAGDLVFFKTSKKDRHAGIYLADGRFMHASTSRGVMISQLQNPYWRDAYWKSRRIL